MGFLSKLFGGKTVDELVARAEDAIARGDHGSAKIDFERAAEKAEKNNAGEDSVAELMQRVDDCCDKIAEGSVAEAERLLAEGNVPLALEELSNAKEVARGMATHTKIQEVIDRLERSDAEARAEVEGELSDKERWELATGSWDEARVAELESYGGEVQMAILDSRMESPKDLKADKKALDAALESADEDGVYIYYEAGRIHSLLGEKHAKRAEKYFKEFIERLDEDSESIILLGAYQELARLSIAGGDFELGMEYLERSVEEFPEDPRSYFGMGVHLLESDLPKEAAEVLQAGYSKVDPQNPDWVLTQALGVAYYRAGKKKRAIHYLEDVVAIFSERGQTDIPPQVGEILAEIHEKDGNLARAADLFAILSRGVMKERHAFYHQQAGRLLAELGEKDEARRMLKRGLALAKESKLKKEIEKQLSALK